MMLGLPIIAKGHAPYGYVSCERTDIYLPDNTQLAALMKAKAYLKEGYSYEAAAHWLSSATGRSVTGPGLCKLMKSRPPSEELYEPIEYREELTANLPYWKNEAKETREEIARLAGHKTAKERAQEKRRKERKRHLARIRARQERILAKRARLAEISITPTDSL